jgi:putative FmdB family regulatory protein
VFFQPPETPRRIPGGGLSGGIFSFLSFIWFFRAAAAAPRLEKKLSGARLQFGGVTKAELNMPTYEYQCSECGHKFEIFQSMKDQPLKKCPACSAMKLKKLISGGAGFIFKGSGFYCTDYRSDSYKKAKENDKPASAGAAASGSGDSGKGSAAASGSGDSKKTEKPAAAAAKT